MALIEYEGPTRPAGVDMQVIARRAQFAVETGEETAVVSRHSQELVLHARMQAQALTRDAELTISEAVAERARLLSTATVRSRQILDEAERMRAQAAAHCRDVLSDAYAESEQIKSATLAHIAQLTARLVDMAEDVIAVADDATVARSQLAQFVLALTAAAERVHAEV